MIAPIEFEPASHSPVALSCKRDQKNDDSRDDCQRTPSKPPNPLVRSEGDLKNLGGGQSLGEKSDAFRYPREGSRSLRITPRMRVHEKEEPSLANIQYDVGSKIWQLPEIPLDEEKSQHEQLCQHAARPQP